MAVAFASLTPHFDMVPGPRPAPQAADYGDEDLIAAYHAGESWMRLDDLFQELVRRHRTRLLNWCLRYCSNRESAADLTQEVFLKVFRNIHNFRGESKFSTWLYVIARNHCLNAAMKSGHSASLVDQSMAEKMPDPDTRDTLAWMEQEQERKTLWSTVQRTLTSTEAQVMLMHYGKEIPLADVSNQLGLTNRSGAKAYIVSARRKLDAVLGHRRTPLSRRQS
jgi:RNA polymerase sigma-70 factor, ECF subfamily